MLHFSTARLAQRAGGDSHSAGLWTAGSGRGVVAATPAGASAVSHVAVSAAGCGCTGGLCDGAGGQVRSGRARAAVCRRRNCCVFHHGQAAAAMAFHRFG